MSRPGFWSPEAIEFLKIYDRQDLIDSGDALAERVSALMFVAISRLDQWEEKGNLYNNRGFEAPFPYDISAFEDFVQNKLHAEINILELLIQEFDDLGLRNSR